MTGKTGAARVALETGCPQSRSPSGGRRPSWLPTGRGCIPRDAGPGVWAAKPVDRAPSRAAAAQSSRCSPGHRVILDAITAILAQIRGEEAAAKRWDPRQPRAADDRQLPAGGSWRGAGP